MDSMTEKYSAFDFFNLLIAGMLFLLAMGLEDYSCTIEGVKKVADIAQKSKLIFILVIGIFVCASLVAGSVIQVLGIYIIDWKLGWEKRIIESCLQDDVLWNNSVRLNTIRNKAKSYLKKSLEDTDLTKEQSAAFFSHCVYYLHIRGLDKKVEKMRETQGLSQLLTCVFGAGFCGTYFNLFIKYIKAERIEISNIVIMNFVFALLTLLFYFRYKISGKNRIRMVLSVYDACVEMEENARTNKRWKYEESN